MPVSLTRSGLPTIIPVFHRKLIRAKGARADLIIKFYLSFSVNRIIPLAPRVTRSTFKTLIEPISPVTVDRVSAYCTDIRHYAYELFTRYVPNICKIPLNQGWMLIQVFIPLVE